MEKTLDEPEMHLFFLREGSKLLLKHLVQLITPTHILTDFFDLSNKQAALQTNKQA